MTTSYINITKLTLQQKHYKALAVLIRQQLITITTMTITITKTTSALSVIIIIRIRHNNRLHWLQLLWQELREHSFLRCTLGSFGIVCHGRKTTKAPILDKYKERNSHTLEHGIHWIVSFHWTCLRRYTINKNADINNTKHWQFWFVNNWSQRLQLQLQLKLQWLLRT